ncbi:MAG TPA: LysR substrate-binding domain-containing protein [Rhizobiaceae bacterium]|nr:LysR substrate-binding domain-containing protein [Rhizobiaceae bacterium]
MQTLRQLLPSAGSLIVFESAGRLGSFTAAGRELGMTQAAVSYAIRSLEDRLGVRLFVRGHRRVDLTEAGNRFLADVTLGLSHIRKSAQEVSARGQGGHVTLSASTAFAAFWMMPRIGQLREALPGVDLRIQTADRDIDLVSENVPLGIRGGASGDWPGYESALLEPEEVCAVASPVYVERHGAPATVAELTRHRLIHLEEPYRPAADWNDWFFSAGVNGKVAIRGLTINDYTLVIQAVLEGQGIALGWRHLTARMVEAGVLVQITDHWMRSGKGFHVVWPAGARIGRNAERVRDWLLGQTTNGA